MSAQPDSENTSRHAAQDRRELLARLLEQHHLRRDTPSPKHAPMSFAQQRLWFLDRLTPGSALYNMACHQALPFAVDVQALHRALNAIVRRHESLRTTFALAGGTPVQIIAPHLDVPLPVEDLRLRAPQQREQDAQRLATEHALAPFDLSSGPLLRAALLRLGDADYLFLLTLHHVVSDGWSMGVFFRELNALYGAALTAQPSPLPELPIQYADFSVWQRGWLKGDVLARQLAYWKTQLAGMATLALATDRPRPGLPSFAGATHAVQIDGDLLMRLRALSVERDATLFMVLLAAFQVLLARYSGQTDIVVGSPVANRNRAETEGLIGFFVNSVVMRTSLAGDPTFGELLERTRETALGAYAHQDIPFEMLVEELHPERDISRNPLFQCVFQLMESSATGAPALAEQVARVPTLQMGTAKFDLNLSLFGLADGIAGSFEYSTDLFDAPRIARMTAHYARLLEEIVRDPAQRVSTIPLLTPRERRQLTIEWNATRAPFPRDEGVLDAFERQAARGPGAPALHDADRAITYGELDARADRLATLLRARGAADGDVVAVCLPRSADAVVAFLAVWKAGAAYLPIDPAYPDERIARIASQARPRVLVTDSTLADRHARWTDAPIVTIGQEDDAAAGAAAGRPPRAPARVPRAPYSETAIAYVIFTSGSTGQPKGVEIPHRGLTNLSVWHTRAFDVRPGDRAMQFASLGFDAAVWEIWPYLTAGASVDVVGDDVRCDPRRLPHWIAGRGITHGFVPTPILEMVVTEPWPACALRVLLTGGDRLRRGVPADLPFSVFNQYGPTESSVVTTSGRVPPDDGSGIVPSIGRPIDNIDVFVVDPNGEPVPCGVPGELWIGGAGLAQGYANAPELTQERFAVHPLDAAERVYRSGDLVRYRPDGEIEFIGRIDQQIKVRGFRVEPGDIESALAQHPSVGSTCVVARHDGGGDAELVAYVEPARGGAIDAGVLREYLQRRLPSYMVPAHIVALDALPLTENGKIDRHALPAPVARSGGDFAPPANEIEAWLAGIWQEELRAAAVGVTENFFDLGGNSLMLVRIHKRIEERFGDRLSVVDLFRYPTVRALVGVLEQTGGGGDTTVDQAKARADRRKQAQARRRPAV